MTINIKNNIITTLVVDREKTMKINGIDNIHQKIAMAIPSDIKNKVKGQNNYVPTFGIQMNKQIPIPISDTFIHILK